MDSLPIVVSPRYTATIPSSGKKVEFRPFTIKEEKILLIANESEDQFQIMEALKDVVRACTFDRVNINVLTGYDFQYLFLKIRAKSVGETSEITLKCPECEAKNPVTINLDKVEVVSYPDQPDPKFQINDSIGIVLRIPQIKDIRELDFSSPEKSFNSGVASLIEQIYTKDKTLNLSDYSQDEVYKFIDSLPHSALEYIQRYVAKQPVLMEVVKYKCIGCGKEIKEELKGLASFF